MDSDIYEILTPEEVEILYPGAVEAFYRLHNDWDFSTTKELQHFGIYVQSGALTGEVLLPFLNSPQLYAIWQDGRWKVKYGTQKVR